MAAKFKYDFGDKVKHPVYGYGIINALITINGKILLKDTYTVAFDKFGTLSTKEKDLTKVSKEEWISRSKINLSKTT